MIHQKIGKTAIVVFIRSLQEVARRNLSISYFKKSISFN